MLVPTTSASTLSFSTSTLSKPHSAEYLEDDIMQAYVELMMDHAPQRF